MYTCRCCIQVLVLVTLYNYYTYNTFIYVHTACLLCACILNLEGGTTSGFATQERNHSANYRGMYMQMWCINLTILNVVTYLLLFLLGAIRLRSKSSLTWWKNNFALSLKRCVPPFHLPYVCSHTLIIMPTVIVFSKLCSTSMFYSNPRSLILSLL